MASLDRGVAAAGTSELRLVRPVCYPFVAADSRGGNA